MSHNQVPKRRKITYRMIILSHKDLRNYRINNFFISLQEMIRICKAKMKMFHQRKSQKKIDRRIFSLHKISPKKMLLRKNQRKIDKTMLSLKKKLKIMLQRKRPRKIVKTISNPKNKSKTMLL